MVSDVWILVSWLIYGRGFVVFCSCAWCHVWGFKVNFLIWFYCAVMFGRILIVFYSMVRVIYCYYVCVTYVRVAWNKCSVITARAIY